MLKATTRRWGRHGPGCPRAARRGGLQRRFWRIVLHCLVELGAATGSVGPIDYGLRTDPDEPTRA